VATHCTWKQAAANDVAALLTERQRHWSQKKSSITPSALAHYQLEND
jgi:hypothetical protein